MAGAKFQITVEQLAAPERIDRYLASRPEIGASRAQIQKALKAGQALVNRKPVPARHKVSGGETISLTLPEPEPLEIVPENIPLDIRYEDDELLVVNKPAGMVTHPAVGARKGTLVHALLAHTQSLSEANGPERAGIVHRLDKNTTGLLVVAKTASAHRNLQEQLQSRSVSRTYLGIVCGHMRESEGEIDKPIGRSHRDRKKMAVTSVNSREALTRYRVLERFKSYDFLEIKLATGRTHQIRVHFSHLGHPIFGDPEYGGREKWRRGLFGPERQFGGELLKRLNRQALHAHRLQFVHPATGEEMSFEAEAPEDFLEVLDAMRARR